MPSDHRENLLLIFQSALAAVNGRACVRMRLENRPLSGKIYMLAVGKAACAMAQGAHDALGKHIIDALIVTKKGYAESLPWPVLEAGHPLVDESSLEAGRQLLAQVDRIPQDVSMLVLISGGASALVEVLPPQITLDHYRDINRWLLGSGLDINNYSRIRRRLSCLKGGRLAKLLAPRKVLCLIISDVPGNDLRAIGSGPLVADEDLRRPLTLPGLPDFIIQALQFMPPAPAPDDSCFQNIKREIVATLDNAKTAAVESAKKLGYPAFMESAFISGDAMEAGTRLANKLLQSVPGVVHVWGGETTVMLPESPGRGGRNQNLALAAAMMLQGQDDVWFLAAGTDGADGPTDDAGALVDGGTISRGASAGLDARQLLARADAGSFLEASGDLIQTGPTGTNVMDMMLGLREKGRN
ncbi:MAG: glycerate kinase type-2 family protein [Sulfuricaulis sp.]